MYKIFIFIHVQQFTIESIEAENSLRIWYTLHFHKDITRFHAFHVVVRDY